ncbi:MAG: hypothetical protein IJU64_03920 [Bacilli bacterium]|nr:hypothetical protein [Bacilli bacterium]
MKNLKLGLLLLASAGLLAACGGRQVSSQPTTSSEASSQADSSEDESSEDESSEDESSEDTSEEESSEENGHGAEGSEKVSWYLIGEGTAFSEDWTVAGAIQLYSNPGSETDKGMILNVTFGGDEKFKVADGAESTSTWYGYDMVNTSTDGETPNAGVTAFEGVDDGFGGKNISCKEAGSYDIYVNGEGQLWIQAAAA